MKMLEILIIIGLFVGFYFLVRWAKSHDHDEQTPPTPRPPVSSPEEEETPQGPGGEEIQPSIDA